MIVLRSKMVEIVPLLEILLINTVIRCCRDQHE